MYQRLSAGDGDHRGAALVDGLQALLNAEALVQYLLGIIDFAATGTGEVATEQGFQHQHQGETLFAAQLFFENIL